MLDVFTRDLETPRVKIAHVVHGFLPEHDGGTERYVDSVARCQRDRGHDVVVAAGSYSDRYDGFVRSPSDEDGLAIYRASQRGSYAERWDHEAHPELERALLERLEELRPDVVHVHHWLRLSNGVLRALRSRDYATVFTAHDLWASCPRGFRVRPDAPFCERPLAVSSCLHCVTREDWHDDALVANKIEDFAHNHMRELEASHAILAPSAAHARVLARFTNTPEARIRVLAHPRLADFEAQDRPASDGPLRVAHWGHLLDYKGPHVLLEALHALPAGCGDVEVALWGRADDPDYRARIDALCDGLTVDRRESFGRDELAELRADIAVFPSLAHESWSFVVDEALAKGIPVVVSARGAPPERLGEAGLSFAPGDAVELARVLSELARDRARVQAMHAACQGSGLALTAHCEALDGIYAEARKARDDATSQNAAIEAYDLESRSFAARLTRSLEDRARWLAALHRSAESEVHGHRQDAQDAQRRALDAEAVLRAFKREIEER